MYRNTATRLMCINRSCASETKAKKGKFEAALVYSLTLLALISSFFADAKVGAGMEKEKVVAQTRTSLVLEIGKALQQKDAETKFFRLFNGGADKPSDFWKARLAILANNPQTALGIDIQQLTNEQLKGAFGAFTRKGVKGQPAIYLNQNWLEKQAGKAGLQRVMAEEMGHAIDFYLNGNLETPGDEGEAFAHSLLNLPVSAEEAQRMLVENDMESLVIEGKEVVVEDAAVYFNQVYKNGTGTNYDLQSNNITSIQRVLGTGFKFTSTNPADATFALNSGNNVGGTLTYVDPQGVVRSVSGGITRKEQGNPSKGFYFYVSPTEAYWLVIPGYESQYANGQNVSTSSDKSNMLSDLNSMLTAQQSAPKITVSSPTVAENGNEITFTVAVSPGPSGGYTFSPTLTAGSAAAGSDYTATMEYSLNNGSTWSTASASPTISATQSQTSILIKVPVIDDNLAENSEIFTLNTGAISGTNGILNNDGAYGVGTITDNEGQPVTITLNDFTKVYGDAAFSVVPTQSTNPNGGYSYAVTSRPDLVDVNNAGSVTIKGAGTAQVTITQAAGNGYAEGSKVVTITINKAHLTVTAVADSKTYDKVAYSGNNGVSYSSFAYNENSTVLTGTLTYGGSAQGAVNANTYNIVPAGLTSDNYDITFASGALTINARTLTVTASATGKVYDGNNTASVTLNNNRISGDVLTINSTSATFNNANVGTGKTVTVAGISISGTDAGNYTLAATTATTTADITAKAVTIAVAPATKVYGNTDPAFTPTITGLVGQDVLSGTLVRAPGNTVGTYAFSGLTNSNYTVTYTTPSFSITARTLTVTATAAPKVYDGNTAATETLSDDRVSGDVLTVSNTGATFSDANVGTGKTVTVPGLSLSGADAANYSLAATTATATADITAKAVTVTVTPATKVYGTTDPVFTYTPAGLVNGEQLTGSVTRAAGNAVGNYAFSGLSNGNYAITYSPANFNITTRTLTVTATANNKPYDGNATAVANLNDNRVPADALTLSYGAAVFNNANVGTAKPVTVSGIVLGGAAAANYTLAATTANATANITAIPATVTVSPSTKLFGAPDPVFTYTTAGLLGSDVLTGSVVRTPGETMGNYTFSGLSNGNYTITYVPAAFNISQSSLAISGQPQGAALCQGGTLSLTVTVANAAGYQWFKNGAAIAGANAATYTKANITTADAGTYHVVVTGAIGYGNATSANATVTVTQAVTATIGTTGSAAYCPGSSIVLTANAGAISYQWMRNGTAIAGATARTYTATAPGSYTVAINMGTACGTTTSAAFVYAMDPAGDCDGDGIINGIECPSLGASCEDTDGDGTPDYLDLDSDGDGISDNIEKGPSGTPVDTDGDGIPDFRDLDSDNDGISDAIEKGPTTTPVDTDGDGVPDFRDLDTDNDGIPDAIEKGPNANPRDTDGDGVPDFRDLDSDNDGIPDATEKGPGGTPLDTDGDGTPDFRDVDSDNDGIPDAIEKGPTATPVDTDGDGVPDYRDLDSDNDGIPDAIEKGPSGTPVDTDGDGVPDFRDLDSDNDGVPDATEKGPSGTPRDTDGDGIPDFSDLDSDNDGIPDATERGPGATPIDTDGDGVPDFRDVDSDNDGIPDATEKGPSGTPLDTDGDGTPDYRDQDSDNDGISDRTERGNTTTLIDTDGDGIPDYRELDSDNDGKPDAQEGGTEDCDGDGIPNFRDEQECLIDILVPDVFTPNGDGINDEIKPVLPGIVTFKSFKVFNRWGNLLYETREAGKGWDGRYHGALQPTETYLWFAEAIGKDGRTIIKRGTLSLLR